MNNVDEKDALQIMLETLWLAKINSLFLLWQNCTFHSSQLSKVWRIGGYYNSITKPDRTLLTAGKKISWHNLVVQKCKHVCIYRGKMWEMTHQSILGFVPLIILSCASLSVARGYKWSLNGNPCYKHQFSKAQDIQRLFRLSHGD